MSSTNPTIFLNKKLLSDGLYNLTADLSASLTTNHDAPALSPHQLVTVTETLSAYIAENHQCNHRRSKAPLDPANLPFHSFRIRSPAAETVQVDEEGTKTNTKGEKDWYYLALSETEVETGNVQVLAEGEPRKAKAELLEGYNETLKAKLGACQEAMNEKRRGIKGGGGEVSTRKEGEGDWGEAEGDEGEEE